MIFKLKSVGLALAGLALGAVGLVAVARQSTAHADPATARQSLALSLTLFNQGNATAARSHALKAVSQDPSWGLAHAVLARTYLALGEGQAAEGELRRARDSGFDMGRAHQLSAEAWLLQGDTKRALAEAEKTDPRYRLYGLRIAARALAAQGKLPQAQRVLAKVLRATNGNDGLAWTDLGRVRQQSSDIGGAITAADRALAIDRGNVDALVLRGELVRSQFGLIAALPWFETALKVDPWRHDALIQYAATLGDAGRYSAMLEMTRRALAARPGSPQALYLQAVMAARADNDDLARSLLQRTNGVLAGQPGALLLGGLLDFRAGAYQQAIDQWRWLLSVQPMNLEARRLLGAALLKSGDSRGALDIVRAIAVRGDADSYVLGLAGQAFEQSNERDWAARLLDRAAIPARDDAKPFGSDTPIADAAGALDRRPDDPIAAVTYIRGLIDDGQAASALAEAQRLARLFPGAPQGHLLVGDTLMMMKRFDAAASAYARAANLRFDEATMLRSVEALDRAGDREKAATVLALFLSQNPQNIVARRLTGHWQIASGDWDAAITTLEGLRAQLGNRDAALLAELGLAYAGADDVDSARLYAAAGYRLAPLNPATTDAFGWALFQAGEDKAALELMRKAVSIAPRHAGLRWHIAQVEAELGDKLAARADITRALADPRFPNRAEARALLATLGA
ncbi:MAG: tetratricopeptide repeat protein [Sphingomonas sp.]|uniref:tetratricopeptide repeat protein n=1 Tax=Sphingomonas sp. TaxID=28214 RepID=UPI0035A8B123|nr:tetratricopeptide repeat protein [Sphingomonas sp.]